MYQISPGLEIRTNTNHRISIPDLPVFDFMKDFPEMIIHGSSSFGFANRDQFEKLGIGRSNAINSYQNSMIFGCFSNLKNYPIRNTSGGNN